MLSRAEISARLKAARWLASPTQGDVKPTALSVKELAELEPLKRNEITKNRIEEVEQAKAKGRDMELEKVAEALGLPDWWFTVPDLFALLRSIEQPADEGGDASGEPGGWKPDLGPQDQDDDEAQGGQV
jgi:hypothetical protein